MEQDLSRFHYRVAQRITGRQSRRRAEGSREYLEEIRVYIMRRQNMVTE